MATKFRWNLTDLLVFPENDGKRYELIDGELHVSTQPDWRHQYIATHIAGVLNAWSGAAKGGIAITAPGVILSREDAVAPDIVWVSKARIPRVLRNDGKLHAAPDLAVEVLSPGPKNEQRDREAKLDLYSRYGVQEYWIVDWRERTVQVYRHRDGQLRLIGTLAGDDVLASPLLPDLSIAAAELFAGIPTEIGAAEDEGE
jgi:Uma2 family endonuclease